MSNQILISSGAKLRDLDDVIIGTDGVLSSLGFNVANGVPKLDENGKILVSQLPNSVMEFKGVWNAATNTPTLVDGTGNAGDVYLCNVAGTVNFGAGPIAFAVGDYAVYTGTVWARSSGATGTVTSVGLSRDGDALSVTGSPITTSGTINIGFAGTNLQYINGAGNLVTFPDLTVYVPTSRTLTINDVTYDLSANRTWTIDSMIYPEEGIAVSTGTAWGDSIVDNSSNWNTAYNNSIVSAEVTGTTTKTLTLDQQDGGTITASWTDYDTAPVTSVFGRTGAVVAVSGDYTTAQVTESGNLYFTDARARAAISLTTLGTSGAATYNNTTGVLNIPNYTTDLTGYVPYTGATTNVNLGVHSLSAYDLIINHTSGSGVAASITKGGNGEALTVVKSSGSGNAASITGGVTLLSELNLTTDLADAYIASAANWNTAYTNRITSATSPLSITSNVISISQANTSTSGYISSTDWNTFNSKQNALTNPVTGTGTIRNIAYWASSSSITGESNLYWDDTNDRLGIGTNAPLTTFDSKIAPTGTITANAAFRDSSTNGNALQIWNGNNEARFRAIYYGTASDQNITFWTINAAGQEAERLRIGANGNIGINTSSISGTYGRLTIAGGVSILNDNNAKLEIGRYSSAIPFSYIKLGPDSSGLRFTDKTDTFDIFTITNEGLVGIGTTAPAMSLQIGDGTKTGNQYIRLFNSASDIYLGQTGSNLFGAGNGQVLVTDGTYTSNLSIGTLSASANLIFGTNNTERLRITNGGQVGINNTSPLNTAWGNDTNTKQLSINGSSYAVINLTGANGGTARTYSMGVGDNMFYMAYDNTLTAHSLVINNGNVLVKNTAGISGGGALQVNGNVNINGVFQINGTTIGGGGGSGVTGSGTTNYVTKWTGASTIGNGIMFDTGTNVGLGTTSPTPHNGSNALIIRGGGGGRGIMELWDGATTGKAVFQQVGGLTYFGNLDKATTGGDVYFLVNGSGTSADVAMSLKANKNVGVNTTTPESYLSGTKGISIYDTTNAALGLSNGTNNWLHYLASSSFRIWNNTSNEVATFHLNGNIALGGVADNGYKLQVNGGGVSYAYGYLSIYRGSSSPNDIFVGNTGSVFYIGGNTQVVGSVSASGGFFDTSDARLKTLVEDNYLLSSIANVKAKLYIKDGRKELGYYAQDLEAILPSAVKEGADGFLSLSYAQVHTAKIAVIEDEVTILKNRVSELETKLQKYDA